MAADDGAEPLLLEPDLRRLLGNQPYRLRDEAGRAQVLGRLTRLVVGLAGPVQVWHGPEPTTPAGVPTPRARRTQVRHPATAPRQASLAERPRHLPLPDGTVARVVALTCWPPAASPDWLGPLAAVASTTAVHLRPLTPEQAVRLLRRRVASLLATENVERRAGRLPDPAVEVAADAARDLREELARGSTRLVRAQVLFGLTAPDPDLLDLAERRLHDAARALLAEVRCLAFEQDPGWQGLQPGGAPLPGPWRLLDAASAAATIPLPVGPGPTGPGVLAGVDPVSGMPVAVDRFREHNATRLVVGTSGAGKSYAAKLELVRQLTAGVSAVVVDPEGEFGPLTDALGGLSVRVGSQAAGADPAGLDPVGLACRPTLSAAEGLSVLACWAAALLGAGLGPVDLALLDGALAVLRAGAVTPTAGGLLTVLSELADRPPFRPSDLPARLAPAAGGALGDVFAPNPALAAPPGLVTFDLRDVPERARPAGMACVLTWAWSRAVAGCRQDVASPDSAAAADPGPPPAPMLLVLDEAHLILDDPAAAQLLAQFARRARKYRLGLELVTQRLSDVLGHPAGKAILANAATKLLLACEDHERAAVAAGLGLTGPEADLLRPGARGSGLLLGPHLRTPLQVVGTPTEHVLASAGPR